ncbi:MAG: bis(5'-nucleosyl)-tetraphosphatase (symmetrical) YqeK [Anaerolineae bacterium]
MNTEDYARYVAFLKLHLSPPRLDHSIGVMRVMQELASIYSLDSDQATTAGLLHDAAKDLPTETQLALAEQAQIKFSYPCERHPVYLHAPVGAFVVSNKLGITDSLVLDAIAFHSYSGHGENFDTPLARCLRSADILAPVNDWKGMRRLKSIVYTGQLQEAALLQSGWLIEYFREIGLPIHPTLDNNFCSLSTQLQVNDSFFERW